MFAEKIKETISSLQVEIKNVQAEMERVDSNDSHLFYLRKTYANLQSQLESQQKLLRVFGEHEAEIIVKGPAVNL